MVRLESLTLDFEPKEEDEWNKVKNAIRTIPLRSMTVETYKPYVPPPATLLEHCTTLRVQEIYNVSAPDLPPATKWKLLGSTIEVLNIHFKASCKSMRNIGQHCQLLQELSDLPKPKVHILIFLQDTDKLQKTYIARRLSNANVRRLISACPNLRLDMSHSFGWNMEGMEALGERTTALVLQMN